MIRQPRAWTATAVFGLAALVLTASLPVRAAVQGGVHARGTTAGTNAGDAEAQALILPPELQKKLQELLAAIGGVLNGRLSARAQRASGFVSAAIVLALAARVLIG